MLTEQYVQLPAIFSVCTCSQDVWMTASCSCRTQGGRSVSLPAVLLSPQAHSQENNVLTLRCATCQEVPYEQHCHT